MKISNFEGKIAEIIAEFFLNIRGYQTVKKNHRNYIGEIDLITKKGNTLAIIEVKKRKSFKSALYSFSKKQRERIEKITEEIINDKDFIQIKNIRFDQIILNEKLEIAYLPGQWIAGD